MMLVELDPPVVSVTAIREFGDHLRMGSGFADDGSQDALLEIYLRTAMAAIESRIGKALIARRFSWSLTRWRDLYSQKLPIAPISQIESLTLYDALGMSSAVDTSDYILVSDAQSPELRGTWGRALPTIRDHGRVEITFNAGYGPFWADIPADLRQAVLLLSAYYYESRIANEKQGGAIPFGVQALLDPYRPVRL